MFTQHSAPTPRNTIHTSFSSTRHHDPKKISLVLDVLNPLNAELNPIRHLLALEGARHFVHVSRIRVNVCSELKYESFIFLNVVFQQHKFIIICVAAWRNFPAHRFTSVVSLRVVWPFRPPYIAEFGFRNTFCDVASCVFLITQVLFYRPININVQLLCISVFIQHHHMFRLSTSAFIRQGIGTRKG